MRDEIGGDLTRVEILGITQRTFRQLNVRYEAEGVVGCSLIQRMPEKHSSCGRGHEVLPFVRSSGFIHFLEEAEDAVTQI